MSTLPASTPVPARTLGPALSTEAIAEVRRLTGVTMLSAVHALTVSAGRVAAAIAFLRTPRCNARSMLVDGSHLAARLAARLIGSGLWFECEQLARERWRFAVAPAGYATLLELHLELSSAGHGVQPVHDTPPAARRSPSR